MNKLIGSWSFHKKTLMIAIPVMIQNLITSFNALKVAENASEGYNK